MRYGQNMFVSYLLHFWADWGILGLVRKPTDPSRIHSSSALAGAEQVLVVVVVMTDGRDERAEQGGEEQGRASHGSREGRCRDRSLEWKLWKLKENGKKTQMPHSSRQEYLLY